MPCLVVNSASVHGWDVFFMCVSGRMSLFLDLLPKARAERALEALALQGWELAESGGSE